jgi:hypothetical protein
MVLRYLGTGDTCTLSHWHPCLLDVPKMMVLPQRTAWSSRKPTLERASLIGSDLKTDHCSRWYPHIERLIPRRDRYCRIVISAVASNKKCTEVDDTTIKDGDFHRGTNIGERASHWQPSLKIMPRSMIPPRKDYSFNERSISENSHLAGNTR